MALALLRGIIRGLLALVLLLGILLIALPFLIDLTFVKDYLRTQGEQALEGPIDYDEATLSLFPSPRAEFHHLSLGGVSPFFRADHLKVKLDFWSLIHQHIVIRDLIIERPQVTLHQAADRSWNIPGIDDEPPSKGGDEAPPPIPVIWQLTITNGRVTFLDETLDTPLFIEVDAIEAVLSSLNDGWPADVRLSGHPVTLGSDARLTLTGTIDWTRAAFEPGDRVQKLPFLQGDAKLDRISIRHLQRIVDRGLPADRSNHMDQPDHAVVSLASPVEMVPGTSGYDLLCPRLTLHVPDADWAVQGLGRLGGLFTKTPTMFVSGSAEPVRFQRLSGFFPLVPEEAREVIVDHQIDGIVRIQKATVAGSLAEDEPLSVVGAFEVARGHVLVQPEFAPLDDIAGTVVLEPDLITIVRAKGRYESSRLTTGAATIDFHESSPWLEARASFDLAVADIVSSLQKGLGPSDLEKYAKTVSNPRGTVRASFALSGPLDQPEALTMRDGEIHAQEVGFQQTDLPAPVRSLNGRARVSPTHVRFEDMTATLGRSTLTVNGSLLMDGEAIFRDVDVTGRIHADQLRPFLRDRAEPLSMTGTVGLTADLEGLVRAPAFALDLALDHTEIVVPDVVEKPAGLKASVDARGRVAPHSVLLIDRLDVSIPPLQVRAEGEVGLVAPHGIRAKVELRDPMPLDRLPKHLALAGGAIQSGTFRMALTTEGQGFDWSEWHTDGKVVIDNATITPKEFTHPIEDLSLRVELTNQRATVKNLSFRMAQSRIRVSGTVYQWMTAPEASLELRSPHLDVDQLLDQRDQAEEKEPAPGDEDDAVPWDRIQVAIDVNVQKGRFRETPFTNLQTHLSFTQSTLDVEPFFVEIDGDPISGKLRFPLDGASPDPPLLSIDVRNLSMEELFQLIGQPKPRLTGRLELTGSLEGRGSSWKEVSRTLSGEVKGTIRKGRVLELTALSRILQILNLPTLLQGKVDLEKGLPFDRIAGTLSFEGSTISTQKLLLESPVLTLSAAGTYDLEANELNMVTAVSPLGSYFKLIKSIPLFGKLFAGKRQEFDTAFFEIKGPPQDPSVQYMPLKSLEAGVTGLASLAFDVLKNTVTLPKELISPSQ